MRKAAYIVGGLLFGWIAVGSIAALLVETVVYYLGVEWTDSVHTFVYGLLALSGLVGGGVFGAGLADRRARPPTPLKATIQPERATTSPTPRPAVAQGTPSPTGSGSEANQMRRLLDLYAEGVLSREEFDAARARLLET